MSTIDQFKDRDSFIPRKKKEYAGEGPVKQRYLPANATPLEQAVVQVLEEQLVKDVPVARLWNPATCPAQYLSYLAWALSVDVWDPSWDEETKRRACADAFLVHRRKGTLAALENALAVFGFDMKVTEWWQKDPKGDPYTFDIEIEVSEQGMDSGTQAQVLMVVDHSKNARSHLDTLSLIGRTEGDLYMGSALTVGNGTEVQAFPGQDVEAEPATFGLLAGTVTSLSIAVYP